MRTISGQSAAPSGMTTATLLATKRTAFTMAAGSAGGLTGIGDSFAINGTQSAIVPTATEGIAQNYASSTAIGSQLGIGGNLVYRTGRNITMWWPGKIQETANVRYWMGLTDQLFATMVQSDNPAGNYACFRYASAADTNWKCITKDNVTQNISDSGVVVDTARHLMAIVFDDVASAVKFYIDGVLRQTHSVNLPAAGTNLRWVYGGQTTEAVAKNIRFEWVMGVCDL